MSTAFDFTPLLPTGLPAPVIKRLIHYRDKKIGAFATPPKEPI